jgi:uncharacterized protein YuzE
MKIKYFADTDTALIEFSDEEVRDTRDVAENVTADLDERGRLVSLTLEHAREQARLPEMTYEEVG